MPSAWRLVHKKYINSAFSGEGARIAGGRWNAEGHAVVYTAGSLSLALLEIIVHLEFKEALKLYKAIPVDIPGSLLLSIDPAKLPDRWSVSPPQSCTQFIGNCWMEGLTTPALRVPSAIVPNESNYLLNPAHPEFCRIQVGEPTDLPIDPRVLERLA